MDDPNRSSFGGYLMRCGSFLFAIVESRQHTLMTYVRRHTNSAPEPMWDHWLWTLVNNQIRPKKVMGARQQIWLQEVPVNMLILTSSTPPHDSMGMHARQNPL
jgi:hypothetical protein